MEEIRRIKQGTKKDIIVGVDHGDLVWVYRTQDRPDGVLCKPEAGVPVDYNEYFKVQKDTPDNLIIQLVDIYERGHERGWTDGQFQLRKELQRMLGIYK